MSNEADIWMPFNVGDYLKDTARLDTLAHGAYILLILDYWVSGGPLPDDDYQLRNITKISPHNWKKIRFIIEKFFIVKDGVWHHKRIDAELAKALINMENARIRGKKGADARWGKDIDGACPGDASSPSPSSSPKNLDSNRDDFKMNRDSRGKLLLKGATIDKARKLAPDWDIHGLEDLFNELNHEKVVRHPDRAFLAFVKTHVNRNKQNP